MVSMAKECILVHTLLTLYLYVVCYCFWAPRARKSTVIFTDSPSQYFGTKSSPCIILCYAIPGNVYPVTEGHASEKSLLGVWLFCLARVVGVVGCWCCASGFFGVGVDVGVVLLVGVVSMVFR